jgi:hypothetical protein
MSGVSLVDAATYVKGSGTMRIVLFHSQGYCEQHKSSFFYNLLTVHHVLILGN